LIQSGEEVALRGHITGAINAQWPDYLASDGSGLFKSTQELYDYFVSKGLIESPCDQELILSCNEGVHARFAWFVLNELLVYRNQVVYEGSAAQWADDPLLPMESGF
jgi:3-mercaptopyruvate sulfurtransferase SseA